MNERQEKKYKFVLICVEELETTLGQRIENQKGRGDWSQKVSEEV